MKCVSFTRNEGCYDWLHQNKKSVRYSFDFGDFLDLAKEKEIKKSYVIEIEEDNIFEFPKYTALELANELDYVISGYFLNSDKVEIKKLITFLEEINRENEILMCEDMIEYYGKEIIEVSNKKVMWQEKLKILTED